MYIVHIASEFAPIAKVGGLADVMLGLGRELVKQGHTLNVIVPKYDVIDVREMTFEPNVEISRSYFQGNWYDNSFWKAHSDGNILLTLLESHHPGRFFSRGCIYGCHDDVDRFLYFCRAALDWLQDKEDTPDIIHIHDWETAACAFLIRQGPFRKRFENTKVVLTIHNMAYQGWCHRDNLENIGLSGAWFASPERLQDDFGSSLNLLKGGIVFSDYVTTVSSTYAKEVLTQEGGKGLQLTLLSHASKFCGVLNGIDTIFWDPAHDKYLEDRYTAEKKSIGYEEILAGKKRNKEFFLEKFAMGKSDEKPLLAIISRLVPQKGIELMKHILSHAHKWKMQCILLGTAPDPHVHWNFVELEKYFLNSPDVRIVLQHEEGLAHKLYAASDMFLVPSLFEPCGLTQLIALRYGSIPIVRKTGGLADTIFDVDFSERSFSERNGYVFEHPNEQGVDSAIGRACSTWYNNKELWQKVVMQAMRSDFSWEKSAKEYVKIYSMLCKKEFR